MAWTPKALTEFEIGQAMAGIEGIERLGKPLSEVGCRAADPADIEHDLRACLNSMSEATSVQVWIRKAGDRYRFGFYGQPWVLAALDFLDGAELQPSDRAWINGLLFGYQSAAIQRFIEGHAESRARESSPQPNRTQNSGRTSHLRGIPAGSRR